MKTVSQVRKPVTTRNRVAQLRQAAGLQMRELAGYCGVSHLTICRIEAGKAPDVKTALLLARFFETTVEDLFGHFARKQDGTQ